MSSVSEIPQSAGKQEYALTAIVEIKYQLSATGVIWVSPYDRSTKYKVAYKVSCFIHFPKSGPLLQTYTGLLCPILFPLPRKETTIESMVFPKSQVRYDSSLPQSNSTILKTIVEDF